MQCVSRNSFRTLIKHYAADAFDKTLHNVRKNIYIKLLKCYTGNNFKRIRVLFKCETHLRFQACSLQMNCHLYLE